MLRFLIRLMGLVLLAGGFVAIIVDGTCSLAGDKFCVTSVTAALQGLNATAYGKLQGAVLAHFPAFVWDQLSLLLRFIPLSVALCGLGGLLILLSHKQNARIGYLPE